MRIAFIVNTFPSLPETFILNQIIGLLERGHEVDIYAQKPCYSKVHSDVQKYNLQGRTFYRVNPPANKYERLVKLVSLYFNNLHKKTTPVFFKASNFLRYGTYALRLPYETIPFLDKETDYDIIHCHFGPNGILGINLQDIGAIQGKLVVTFHGFDGTKSKFRALDGYKELFDRAELITVNSNYTKGRIQTLGCSKAKIFKLPMGVRISELNFFERQLQPGCLIQILTVARLVEKKGVEYSIKAVAEVVKEYPNVCYKIAGDGPLRQSLQALINQLDLSDKIKLLGWKDHDEVRQLYADAHIFILSSVTAADGDQEGQGLVLQEAQAVGLPVVATLHNGFPESILDKQSGFLVPERDVCALAEKLIYLIEHPQIWSTMGRIGREFVVANFDAEKLNDRLVQLYQQLLNE